MGKKKSLFSQEVNSKAEMVWTCALVFYTPFTVNQKYTVMYFFQRFVGNNIKAASLAEMSNLFFNYYAIEICGRAQTETK